MAIEAFIARYGLLAIFAGAGLEGEAVVLTGGVLAHKGVFPLWGVALAAAMGSCLVDQLWFVAGRRFRDTPRIRAVKARPAFARALRLMERYPTAFIFGFRFIYGLRTVSPIAIGAAGIPPRRFVPLNMAAAAIWAQLMAWLGFAFGKAIDPWLHDVRTIVLAALAALVLAGVGAGIWHLGRALRQRAR